MTEAPLTQKTFVALLDELIPARDDVLPGAGSLGIGSDIEAKLGEALPLVAAGLAVLDAKAQERGVDDFVSLSVGDRASLVSEVGAEIPGFVDLLVYHAYGAYYQNPRVAVAIGLSGEPPYPRGYELEEGDLGLLDPVREREKLYREVS